MTTPARKTAEPSHVVIDKNTTAQINVGILVTLIAICAGAMLYLNDIQHAVRGVESTLNDVRGQLQKQNDATLHHTEILIRLEGRVNALGQRVDRLEKVK